MKFTTAFAAFGTSYYYTGGTYPKVATLSSYPHPETAAAVYTGSGAWIPNLKVNPVTLSLSQWSDTDFNQYKYIVEFYDWHAKLLTYHQLQSAGPL